jgi:hypothetical protein
MHIELKNSKVLYTEETSRHVLLKCTIINTYDVFKDGTYSKTSTQFWNTYGFCDDFGNLFGVSDKSKLFDYLLSY